jgi:hypothetical protein
MMKFMAMNAVTAPINFKLYAAASGSAIRNPTKMAVTANSVSPIRR